MSNFRALAVVTATLEHVLQDAANQAVGQADVRVGAPTAKLAEDGSPLINLFLFRVLPNTQHRNDHFPSRDGGGNQRTRARIHLDLHYVLSFYGDAAKFEPERLYGAAALALEHAPGLSVAAMEAASADAANQTILAAADLAAEGRAIGLEPEQPSLEDWSKLWSVFFQVPYALSATYVVRNVAIETQDDPGPPTPVATPEIFAAPMGPLQIRSIGPSEGQTGPAPWGGTLHLTGTGIARFGNSLRIDGQPLTLDEDAISGDALALPLDAALFGGVVPRAGAHQLEVVAAPVDPAMPERLRRGSNVVAFAILPVMTQVAAATGPGSAAGLRSGTVTVDIDPPLRAGQSATLLLNAFGPGQLGNAAIEVVAPAAFPASQLDFAFTDLVAGDYLARVDVDGFASQPEVGIDPQQPNFGRIIGPLVDLS
ncbi:hypothetical protein ASD67_19270 [Sphingopyxis sp. Root1497]|uniref:DUF4255 domain-containing protein n=1 Tax=Sphingopyxis sp. Root1497 TaxID=1736474 RepID=UPI0007015281|nr:DUF4255 domain-containing protein [Sphingopyxis sp. Root1497]KQZ61370.1 hypothetical protein ASD67_19270 [Sphingopyxis sp. Root1497]